MNNKTGKLKEILFEDVMDKDFETGIKYVSERKIMVWADESLKSLISSVEGVSSVFVNPQCKTGYMVYLDPRYSKDFVIKEIEAVILTKSN